MHQLRNVDAQCVSMQRLNEQSIKQIQRLTFKISSMRSRQILNAAFISRETVTALGRDVPGRPAFIIISK